MLCNLTEKSDLFCELKHFKSAANDSNWLARIAMRFTYTFSNDVNAFILSLSRAFVCRALTECAQVELFKRNRSVAASI